MKIDLNCDMGEGCGNDAELMDYVSSVNIACGFHAGDVETMRKTVNTAIDKGVAIGAHPSFPDREGFGRRRRILPADEVYDMVVEQINALREICQMSGAELLHVKPHGALYNQAARDAELARAIADAVYDTDPSLVVFGLAGSLSISEARDIGLRTASEVFADRTYQADGSLTPRSEPHALIIDTGAAVAHVLQMVKRQTVTAIDGTTIPIIAETICIHGDGEYALDFAKTIRSNLIENGIEISPV